MACPEVDYISAALFVSEVSNVTLYYLTATAFLQSLLFKPYTTEGGSLF